MARLDDTPQRRGNTDNKTAWRRVVCRDGAGDQRVLRDTQAGCIHNEGSGEKEINNLRCCGVGLTQLAQKRSRKIRRVSCSFGFIRVGFLMRRLGYT